MYNFTPITAQELEKKRREESITLLDIRDPESFSAGHLPGAYSLSTIKLDDFCAELPSFAHPVVVICYHGNSSQRFAQMLIDEKQLSNVYSLSAGFEGWKSEGYELTTS